MERFFNALGEIITSMAAIIFVLLMVIISLIFFSHSFFLEVLPAQMGEWEKHTSSWLLSLGYELTLLVCVCNTQYINKKISYLMAACSGLIIVFFLHAFDNGLTPLEYFKRWFVGLLISCLSYTFSELFLRKWSDLRKTKSLNEIIYEQTIKIETLSNTINEQSLQISKAKKDFDNLFIYANELEEFKNKQLKTLECPFCHKAQKDQYHLTSHKGRCELNPNKNKKLSIYDE